MLTISIDTKSKEPMYEQIYKHIREEIRNGNLACGTKLPSSRGLAIHLEVSRNTIDMAYGQLMAEGYIESKLKRGYFVSDIDNLYLENNKTSFMQENRAEFEGEIKERDLLRKKEVDVIDFSPNGVDMEYFPYGKWRKLIKECLIDDNRELFLSGEHQGDRILRKAVMDYLHQSRGVQCDMEQIIIGAGSDYMLLLLSRIFNKKCVVGMENPGYKQACTIFHNLGYAVCPISVDAQGMLVSELETTNANLAYVTPSHHFPLGTVMSVGRRQSILAWANQKEERYIIEDDYDSEFRYSGRPIPALQSEDRFGKVIYVGTLSKAIAPGIRISFMVLPKLLLERYQTEVSFYFSTVSRIDQKVIGEFMLQGHFERHLNRMRKIYKIKHDVLVQAIKGTHMPVRIVGDSAGLHIRLELDLWSEDAEKVENEFVQVAKEKGILVYPLSDYYLEEKARFVSVLLGFARLSESEIVRGVQGLQEAWKGMLEKTTGLQ